MRELVFSVCFFTLFWACKEPVAEPLPIPDPKLAVSKNVVDLGNILSTSKAYIKLKKDGIGKIKYTVTTNKSWVILENPNGSLGFLADTIKFRVDIRSKDLSTGDNVAILTIKTVINDISMPESLVQITGKFIPTTLEVEKSTINLGTIKKNVQAKISISKIGMENLSYEAISDQVWAKLNKAKGNNLIKDSIFVNIDPTYLKEGAFEAKIVITPTVMGLPGKSKTIIISGFYDDTISGSVDAHTLSKNETWSGNITLNGNIVVPQGIILKIKPGTVIKIKKLGNPITIKVYGKLEANGSENNIIEIKSFENVATDRDWGGFITLDNIEMSYVIIKNALTALNFEEVKVSPSGTLIPNLHHIFFDNNVFAILDLKSNLDSKLKNLSFRDIYYFSLKFAEAKTVDIIDCEFFGDYCYIDVNLSCNNSVIKIANSNFVRKKFEYFSHLEVIDGFKNNTISSSNCFQLVPNQTLTVNGNKYLVSNSSSFANQNIGCGFMNRYPQGRKKAK